MSATAHSNECVCTCSPLSPFLWRGLTPSVDLSKADFAQRQRTRSSEQIDRQRQAGTEKYSHVHGLSRTATELLAHKPHGGVYSKSKSKGSK